MKPVDLRLTTIRAVDSVLDAMTKAFSDTRNGAGFLFIPGDPKASKVWVCDPESRELAERGGVRMMLLVRRGDISLSQLGIGGLGPSVDPDYASHVRTYTEFMDASIFIDAEAGNKMQCETLLSIATRSLRAFRLETMASVNIHKLTIPSISAPVQAKGVQGEPWIATITLRVTVQENFTVTEDANPASFMVLRPAFRTA